MHLIPHDRIRQGGVDSRIALAGEGGTNDPIRGIGYISIELISLFVLFDHLEDFMANLERFLIETSL